MPVRLWAWLGACSRKRADGLERQLRATPVPAVLRLHGLAYCLAFAVEPELTVVPGPAILPLRLGGPPAVLDSLHGVAALLEPEGVGGGRLGPLVAP